jgi:hypothetical protein
MSGNRSANDNLVTLVPNVTATKSTLPSGFCYSSWKRFYSAQMPLWKPDGWTTGTQSYHTVQKIGKGLYYTACDGIARWQWDSTPTSSFVSTITQISSRLRPYTLRIQDVQPYVNRTSFGPQEDEPFTNRTEPCPSPPDVLCQELSEKMMDRGYSLDDSPEYNFFFLWCYSWLYNLPTGLIVPQTCGFRMGLLNPDELLAGVGTGAVIIHWPASRKYDETCPSNRSRTVPPMLNTTGTPAARTIVTDAITFPANDLYNLGDDYVPNSWKSRLHEHTFTPSSVLRGRFTFISPTIYLAHGVAILTVIERQTMPKPMSTYWHTFPPSTTRIVRPAGVVAIRTEDVSSVRRIHGKRDGPNWPQSVAQGNFQPDIDFLSYAYAPSWETVRFNFDNLVDPVPADIYYEARGDCIGTQSHCATITDDTYRPELILNSAAWQSIFDYSEDCHVTMLLDPPVALHPLETTAPLPAITAARPGDSIKPIISFPTPTTMLNHGSSAEAAGRPTTKRDPAQKYSNDFAPNAAYTAAQTSDLHHDRNDDLRQAHGQDHSPKGDGGENLEGDNGHRPKANHNTAQNPKPSPFKSNGANPKAPFTVTNSPQRAHIKTAHPQNGVIPGTQETAASQSRQHTSARDQSSGATATDQVTPSWTDGQENETEKDKQEIEDGKGELTRTKKGRRKKNSGIRNFSFHFYVLALSGLAVGISLL